MGSNEVLLSIIKLLIHINFSIFPNDNKCHMAPRPGLEPGTYGLTEIQARRKPI